MMWAVTELMYFIYTWKTQYIYRLFMNDTLNPPIMLLVHIIVFLNFQAPKKKNEEKK